MTDYWAGWSADQPDFEGPEGGEEFADLTPEHPDDDGGYPIEEFGAADADPGDLSGPRADQPGPIGYDDIPAESPRVDPYAEGDPYPLDGSGLGLDHYPDVPAEVGFGSADPPVGADPDLDPYGDAAQWAEPVWAGPAGLPDLSTPPEPVDGLPWTDPSLLGDPVTARQVESTGPHIGAPGPDELADYAGQELPADGDGWSALIGSDDPATSTLARFWFPEGR